MALSPTSSHGSVFNGGTITAPLTIAEPAGAAMPLTELALSNADMPTAQAFIQFNFAGGGNGNVIETLRAQGTGLAVLHVHDSNTDGTTTITSEFGIYSNPRSTVADTNATLEIADKNGVDCFLVLADGSAVFARHAVIPDADLAASQFGLWLDDTIGATKLMVKAKDSGGTVRTAAIALA